MTWLSYTLAIVLPPLLLVGWMLVQHAWRRQFGQPDDDDDVLAARGGCGNCGCTTPCATRRVRAGATARHVNDRE